LIILENPSSALIEKLEFNGDSEEPANPLPAITPPAIVRPSSLNYKISLLEAAIAFIQKDK
jgi:hypothetical protein